MKHYQIKIVSKSKKSLENFVTFFKKKLQNFPLLEKYFQKNKKRKILTILKSPHVNKKAQEQFQSNVYSKDLNVYLPQYLILFIKKISLNLFLDVRLKIKFPINPNLIKQREIKTFNPSNFKLNSLNTKNHYNIKKKKKRNNKLTYCKFVKKITQFLQVLDIYGELYAN